MQGLRAIELITDIQIIMNLIFKKTVLTVLISLTTVSLLAGCGTDLTYKEPSIDVLKSNVPDIDPSATATPVVLPPTFPTVPLQSQEYVPDSYSRNMNTAGQEESHVSVYAASEAYQQIVAAYQIEGYQPQDDTTNPDGSHAVTFVGDVYTVTVTGNQPADDLYQYSYRIVTNAVN